MNLCCTCKKKIGFFSTYFSDQNTAGDTIYYCEDCKKIKDEKTRAKPAKRTGAKKTEKIKKTSWKATWSVGLGIWGLISITSHLFAIGFFQLTLSSLGFGFGIGALYQISKNKNLSGKELAILGIILNAAYFVLAIIL
jgi:hypothetical protein